MGWNHNRKDKMNPEVYPYAIMVLLTVMAMGFVILKRRKSSWGGSSLSYRPGGSDRKKLQYGWRRRDTARRRAIKATNE